jgi:hypothetical protein
MANVIISGDTSGAITLAAPAVAGTNTISLPASTGTLVVTSGAQTIEFAAGTVSAPAITTTGDTNTGIFFPAADTIAFTEGGVESMRIDSSGNVGIGITSATQKLEVSGGAAQFNGGGLDGTFGDAILFGNTSLPAIQKNRIRSSISATPVGNLLSFEAGTGTVGAYNANQLVLNGAGNVGIGTSSPGARLHVAGEQLIQPTTAANAKLSMRHGSVANNNYFEVDSSGNTIFGTVNAERMRITSDGNLLVGCTSFPGAGTTTTGGAFGSSGGLSAFRAAATTCFFGRSTDGELAALYSGALQAGAIGVASSGMYFGSGTSGTERMRIDSSGNVGIGTSSPGAILSVVKAISAGNIGTSFQQEIVNNNGAVIGDWSGTVYRWLPNNANTNQAYIGAVITSNAGDTLSDLVFGVKNSTTGNTIVEAMRIKQGNVGIGTSSPSQKLTVFSDDVLGGILVTGSNAPGIRINDTTDGSAYSAIFAQNGGILGLGADESNTAANSAIIFNVDSTERMRIDSSGNVGIGTSSPASFGKFAVNTAALGSAQADGINIAVNGTLRGALIGTGTTYSYAGTAANSLWLFSSSNPLYLGPDGATYVAVVTNGSERMRIDSSGNVGIGTSSPAVRLDVNGSILIPNSTQAYQIKDTGGAGRYVMYYSSSVSPASGNDLFIGNTLNNAVAFYTNNTERMRIDSNGNVAIGTSSAYSKFCITTTNGNFGITGGNTSGGNKIQSFGATVASDGYLAFEGNSAEWMRLSSTGDLGIGTTSPSTKLHVVATGGAIRMQDNGGVAKYIQMRSDSTNSYLEHIGGTGDALRINNQTAGTLEFYTSNIERMRINSGGELLVGTTASGGATSNGIPVVAGLFRTQAASVGIASTGVATTVMTFNNNDGDFLVSMRLSGTGAPASDDSVAIICVNGGSASQTDLKTGSNMVISMSGLDLQATQNLFAGANVNWSVMRFSR